MLCSIFWVSKNVASPEYPRTLDLLGDLESFESLVASSSSTRHRKAEIEFPELHMEVREMKKCPELRIFRI
jgi:hypothetical protein